MPFHDAQFIRVDLRTGLNLAKIALTARDEVTRNRNRKNARKAHDTILRFLPKLKLTSQELSGIRPKLARLKSQLQKLGEREERVQE